ncbi:MAG: hypothetical protein HY791_22710 [Deltaproteobacteria bacterium]|nr:hypothetical protein [Deltaproteobacteria bacterium]
MSALSRYSEAACEVAWNVPVARTPSASLEQATPGDSSSAALRTCGTTP